MTREQAALIVALRAKHQHVTETHARIVEEVWYPAVRDRYDAAYACHEAGLTMRQIAAETGIPTALVGRLVENGRRRAAKENA